MSSECKKYQELIIDILYNELLLDNDVEAHINQCQCCKRYWEDIKSVKIELSKFDAEVPIEYSNISNVIEKSSTILNKRKNLRSLIVFIITSSILLSFGVYLAVNGYMKELIYTQLGMYVILPLLLPIIMKVRASKEGYNE